MYKEKTFLAIIPARVGSNCLPRKNILDLTGKPLIAHTIEVGLKSQYIDKVMVTSDDNEILEISKKYDVKIIRRPDELASDMASSFDAIKHTIENTVSYDYIASLQPTSLLRNETHIGEEMDFEIAKYIQVNMKMAL